MGLEGRVPLAAEMVTQEEVRLGEKLSPGVATWVCGFSRTSR